MNKYIILIISIVLLTGCSHIVGGKCNYQSIEGTALIKSKNQNKCTAKFSPQQVLYDIEFTCNDKIKIGSSYPSILLQATHGSCTPLFLTLINEKK